MAVQPYASCPLLPTQIYNSILNCSHMCTRACVLGILELIIFRLSLLRYEL